MTFYTMESYSAIRKENLEALVGKWVQFKITLMDEMIQSLMGEYCSVSVV